MSEEAWEEAYLAFESPEEERRKFVTRLRQLRVSPARAGVHALDLFCGRGNGIAALRQLGFQDVFGVDLSLRLCREGPHGVVAQGDCRFLPLRSRSVELVVIQGGLHHLPSVHKDLPAVLSEVARVLSEHGSVVIVEPWNTPFLRVVHRLSCTTLLRRSWSKIDAFATMVELEGEIYRTWLRNAVAITDELHRLFHARRDVRRFGKILFVGEPR